MKMSDLPDNTIELLSALNQEFYGNGLAHADAFRILPRVIQLLEEHDALVAINKELVEALDVAINIINIEHQERLGTKLCSTRGYALGTATIILAKAKKLNR